MNKEYKIVKPEFGIRLEKYENYSDDRYFKKGLSLDKFVSPLPEKLTAKISKDTYSSPSGKEVYDFINGRSSGLVVSKRAKELLEAEKGVNAEYVPLTIIDVKGKELEDEFFVVNPLERHEVIDLDKSTLKMSGIDKTQIAPSHDNRIAVKKAGTFDEFDLLIPEHLQSQLMMSADLINKIEEAGLTNLKVIEPSEYRG